MTLLDRARQLEDQDPVKTRRDQFHIPQRKDGGDMVYFCGNSLGLMPKAVFGDVQAELEDWRDLAVDGHHHARRPWYPYHESFRESGARLVGARPGEVVFMNTLPANLHFLMASFYRPEGRKTRILSDAPTFPSDIYALQAQIRWHDGDVNRDMLVLEPKEGRHCLETQDIVASIEEHHSELAMVMLAGVNFFTGQAYDLAAISAACAAHDVPFGVDLAHAAGNISLKLHEWGVDFAAWCSYKYLNSGPGNVSGVFIHEKNFNTYPMRLAGWWGHKEDVRFEMKKGFIPEPGAAGWQLSNAPVFGMAVHRASLDLFDEVGMALLSKKSNALTQMMRKLLTEVLSIQNSDLFQIITPA